MLLFRLPVALAHAATVYLASRLARRLGGGPAAMALAGITTALAPVLLSFGHLVTMNVFEPLIWLGVISLSVEILEGGPQRLWLGVGALVGLGVLNKHSMIFLAAGLLAALLLVPERRALASKWVLGAAGLAALIVLPHALWQVANGFPMLELLRAQEWKNEPFALGHFFSQQLLHQGPLALPLWLLGLVFFVRSSRLRAVGIAFVLVELILAALKGKAYYAASIYPPLFAAGGVALERALAALPRLRTSYGALLVVGGLAVAPLGIPLLPEESLVRWMAALHQAPERLENKRYGELPQHFADQHGWERLVAAVAEAQRALDPAERLRARTFAQNYGEASALDLLGQGRVPPPISGHNQWFVWGYGAAPLEATLIVGGQERDHRKNCGELFIAARTGHDRFVMPYEDDLPIFVCRKILHPISEIWPTVKHYE